MRTTYPCSFKRALYLGLTRRLENSEFLLGLKRLIPTSGRLGKIDSDNGSIFIGAAAWILKVRKR